MTRPCSSSTPTRSAVRSTKSSSRNDASAVKPHHPIARPSGGHHLRAGTARDPPSSAPSSASYDPPMLFRVLGDVVVGDNGSATTIAAGKQRALLALLVMDANSVVSRSTLIDGIWGEKLPANPESALHVTMSRLRSQLGARGERIRAEAAGYRLDAARDEVDVLHAESLLRDGRSALASGDSGSAADAFERGLALWTGEALVDLGEYPFCAAAARRLADL